jgi:hypothetical protein
VTYKVYVREEDPDKIPASEMVLLDRIIEAGIKTLGLEGRIALEESECIDAELGAW